MSELKELMRHDAYTRRRGAIVQTQWANDVPGPSPDYCQGCAWQSNGIEGGCIVFRDRRDPWRNELGECKSWADRERRQEVEAAIRAYERRHR